METQSQALAPESLMEAHPRLLLFDGVCNLCSGAVQFIIERDPQAQIHFASLQSEQGQTLLRHFGKDPQKLDSLAFIENGRFYQKWPAVRRLCRYLKGPFHWVSYLGFIPAFLGNALYNLVAKSRYQVFGKKTECWLPSPDLRQRFADT